MPRRLGSSVPTTVSRLLQAGFIKTPPPWFEAVSTVAPQRASITRRMPQGSSNTSAIGTKASTSTDASSDDSAYAWQGSRKIRRATSLRYRPPKPAPLDGYTVRDRVRDHFFKDHPFEAFRGINLVETDRLLSDNGLDVAPPEWTELRQRTRCPTGDDAVDFICCLHSVHGIPLALAYSAGVQQYRSLRASYETMLHSAQVEAQAYGSTWPTEFSALDRLKRAEERNMLDVLKDKDIADTALRRTGGSVVSESRSGSLLDPIRPMPQGWSEGTQYLQGKRAEVSTPNQESKGIIGGRQSSGAGLDVFSKMLQQSIAKREAAAKTSTRSS